MKTFIMSLHLLFSMVHDVEGVVSCDIVSPITIIDPQFNNIGNSNMRRSGYGDIGGIRSSLECMENENDGGENDDNNSGNNDDDDCDLNSSKNGLLLLLRSSSSNFNNHTMEENQSHYDNNKNDGDDGNENDEAYASDSFHHHFDTQSPGESSEDALPIRNNHQQNHHLPLNNINSNNNESNNDNNDQHGNVHQQQQQQQQQSNFTVLYTFLHAYLPTTVAAAVRTAAAASTTTTPSLIMKRILRSLLLSSSAIMLLIVFPLLFRYAIADAQRGSTSAAAFYSAASFVVISLVLSLREILSHLYNWYAPDVQKFVVRILFMVPLYSVQSWLGLRFHGQARIYIILLRDLYEAYVIQSFVYYLIELLGGEDRMAHLLSHKDASLGGHGKLLSHVLPRWEMGMEFLLKIKYGVLQYVVVKTFMTLLTTFVLLPSGMYGEGTFGLHSAYIYTTVVLNISVMHALYCLVKLFHAIKSDLRHPVNWHPVGKFVCVKGIVFFTWWQSVAIYFLRSYGVIGDVGNWSGEDVAGGIIDYLVCVEMVIFSIAHTFTFTYKEYLPEGMRRRRGGEEGGVIQEEGNGEVAGRWMRMKRTFVKIWNTGSGFISWLFDGIDKRRRANNYVPVSVSSSTADNNDQQQRTLHSALLHHCDIHEDEEDNDNIVIPCYNEDEESTYRPPSSPTRPLSTQSLSGFSKLADPLSLREALWSSTVPRETFKDIQRLRVVSGLPMSSFKTTGGQEDSGSGTTDISLPSLNNAESA